MEHTDHPQLQEAAKYFFEHLQVFGQTHPRLKKLKRLPNNGVIREKDAQEFCWGYLRALSQLEIITPGCEDWWSGQIWMTDCEGRYDYPV